MQRSFFLKACVVKTIYNKENINKMLEMENKQKNKNKT